MKSSVTENNTPRVRAGLDNRVTGSFFMQQPQINTLLSRPTRIREVLLSVTELILKLGHRFHALSKVCSHDDIVPLIVSPVHVLNVAICIGTGAQRYSKIVYHVWDIISYANQPNAVVPVSSLL